MWQSTQNTRVNSPGAVADKFSGIKQIYLVTIFIMMWLWNNGFKSAELLFIAYKKQLEKEVYNQLSFFPLNELASCISTETVQKLHIRVTDCL